MGFGIAPGLRKFHKLREEHVKFSPCLCMQVKLVVQVSQDFHTYDKNNIYILFNNMYIYIKLLS